MKQNKIYLNHIIDEINYILKESKILTFDNFVNNETLKRSFTRSIEIIGEASKSLPEDFRNKYSKVEWRKLSGMRDKLIHHYFGVDYNIIWDFIKNKIKELKKEIEKILKNEEKNKL